MTVTNEEAADFLSESFVGGGEHAAEALALCSAAFDKLAAFELMVECSYASEETFCSSWDDTTVSQIMRGDVGPAGLGEVDAETVAKCHRLASRAGGWWVRNPNHPFGAPGFWLHFVPLSLCGCNDCFTPESMGSTATECANCVDGRGER